MASSTAPASRTALLPGPPPAPTSLMDLPAPWLVQLATSSALDGHRDTLEALFRTCTFFRDTVLRTRTAVAAFRVPLTAERFPAELEKLCTVAKRSSRVRLEFEGEWDGVNRRPAERWRETEPHVTHLLVCAAAQLGGEQPLACITKIRLRTLEQTALVPAWVKVLCPNVPKLDLFSANFTLELPLPPHPHLQHLDCKWRGDDPLLTVDQIRQQLSALPSLSSLTLPDMHWAAEEDEQQARRLISSTVTRLKLSDLLNEQQPGILQRLPTQFPYLRELDGKGLDVDDAGLEALLSMPHLESLNVQSFSLKHTHTHRTWRVPQLTTGGLEVQSFARLPLESIPACSGLWWVHPSTDAAAVARVAAAVRRWGGLGPGWFFTGRNLAALLATLGPLIAVLPAAQQQHLRIHCLRHLTSAQVQQLGQQLPASVTHLELGGSNFALADAWPTLLPSLPASVVEVRLLVHFTEQQVVAVCHAAVRPIKVQVFCASLPQQDLDRITSNLACGPGDSEEQQGSLVTLEFFL